MQKYVMGMGIAQVDMTHLNTCFCLVYRVRSAV